MKDHAFRLIREIRLSTNLSRAQSLLMELYAIPHDRQMLHLALDAMALLIQKLRDRDRARAEAADEALKRSYALLRNH